MLNIKINILKEQNFNDEIFRRQIYMFIVLSIEYGIELEWNKRRVSIVILLNIKRNKIKC